MIGDSCHDAEATKELGVDFIGVTYRFGYKTEQDVKKYKNIFYAQSSYDILKYLQLQ